MTSLEKLLIELDDFLKRSDRNCWIITDDIKIYFRKAHHSVEIGKIHQFIDLASIETNVHNKGIFTKTLQAILEKYPFENFFIESVLNPAVATVAYKFNFQKKVISSVEEIGFESYNLYLLRNI